MTVKFAVTFEFETQPPLTHRGTVSGSSAATVVKRALKEAMGVHKGVSWTSLNIVLLERLSDSDAAA